MQTELSELLDGLYHCQEKMCDTCKYNYGGLAGIDDCTSDLADEAFYTIKQLLKQIEELQK